ncbi:MAG: polysaccharide biosynthesis protein [Gammaproteobacteria bacterium]|nr:polysaccharide biosynthesis protein [Gammaproteobacteria bacterium]
MVIADAFSYAIAASVAVWVLSDSVIRDSAIPAIIILSVVVAVPVHHFLGLYASIVRYMGAELLAVGLKSTLLVSSILAAACMGLQFVENPIRIGVVMWAFSLILVIGARFVARIFLSRSNRNRERVIIFGAGNGGAQLTEALLNGDDYLPVALIDEKSGLHGIRIQGLKVFPSSNIEEIIQKTGAQSVLLAIPSASRRRRRHVLQGLSQYPVRVRTMPEIKDIVSGKAQVDEIRDVNVEDLLGRNPVPPIQGLLESSLSGKNVMVTGAGGSIGSEICRQIVKVAPKRLICFEMSEPALYDIDRELRKIAKEKNIDCEIIALLGTVLDTARLKDALDTFSVQTVYHAAAYKHVPIVEQNLFQGILNNVFGTLSAATAASETSVETFVLISTDKAVNPTSVMGATKRLAELVLQAFNTMSSNTVFCMVRFGNVLESSGSVVPLFREQIRGGGPVTVTHRDIIRYFMTIPEASQLVIQAGSMAHGGDVFVLDMGRPVRIEDLAKRMINLMGLTVRDGDNPEGDIEIQYVGLRPAEKLYEELLIGSNVSGTDHPRIMRAKEDFLPSNVLEPVLDELRTASNRLDYDTTREILNRAVKEYVPSSDIDDVIWAEKTGTASQGQKQTVVEFPSRDT